ncbi:hypothetical protein ACFQMB_01975 [Pseudobowmanella zhangzhouensis]|uniref:CC0125/CC1285 family lipoprotein n=1 Tax=Pseudobowmanella zhangzhouensis TaxID=1537679 RepID=UPI0036060ECE
MMSTKTYLSLTAALLLAACSSNQAQVYAPADEEGAQGYTEQQLTDSQYRITFTADKDTASSQIRDYAMLRAAELTLQKGHDWFMLQDSDTSQTSREVMEVKETIGQRQVVRECGLLGCSSYVTQTYQGTSISTRKVAGNISTTLTISMGDGQPTNPNQVFDAAQLADNLRASMDRNGV